MYIYDCKYCSLKEGNEVQHSYGEFARKGPLLKNIRITPDTANEHQAPPSKGDKPEVWIRSFKSVLLLFKPLNIGKRSQLKSPTEYLLLLPSVTCTYVSFFKSSKTGKYYVQSSPIYRINQQTTPITFSVTVTEYFFHFYGCDMLFIYLNALTVNHSGLERIIDV
jgi:hypothetical protein